MRGGIEGAEKLIGDEADDEVGSMAAITGAIASGKGEDANWKPLVDDDNVDADLDDDDDGNVVDNGDLTTIENFCPLPQWFPSASTFLLQPK